ncbi:MAG: hypothetical protein ACLPVY_08175 [Acidimicrobiia bacterium]
MVTSDGVLRVEAANVSDFSDELRGGEGTDTDRRQRRENLHTRGDLASEYTPAHRQVADLHRYLRCDANDHLLNFSSSAATASMFPKFVKDQDADRTTGRARGDASAAKLRHWGCFTIETFSMIYPHVQLTRGPVGLRGRQLGVLQRSSVPSKQDDRIRRRIRARRIGDIHHLLRRHPHDRSGP